MRRPLRTRLADLQALNGAQCIVAFALAAGAVRADADFLLQRCIPQLARTVMDLHRPDVDGLRAAASRLGLAQGWTTIVLTEILPIAVAVCGKAPAELRAGDLSALDAAVAASTPLGRTRHRRLSNQLRSLWRLLYEAGMLDRPAPARRGRPLTDRLGEVTTEAIRASIAAYLEARAVVLRPSTMCSLTTSLAIFGEFCSQRFPELESLADLERHHVEAYCAFVASRPWRSAWGAGRVVGPGSTTHALVSLRSFLDDISSWGWPEAPPRRLVFPSDMPRPPKLLPRALPPDKDAALMAAVVGLEDRFARDGLTILRGTGVRIGELLDLELTHLVDYGEKGSWLKVPLGKLNDERSVPIDGRALGALEDWLAHRGQCRALPRPRDGEPVDFVFVEHGQKLEGTRLHKGLHDAARAAGLAGPDGRPLRVVVHQLRHTYATSLLNAGLSLPALMALLGHRSPEMTLRYATLSSPTLRRAYDEAIGKVRPRIPLAALGRPAMGDKLEWLASEMLKTRLAHGYCARELVAEACPYANICENCANFVTAPEFAPILDTQLADVRRLRDDAQARGWDSEVARHQRVIESLEGHLRRLQS
jgi:integrase